MKTPDTADPVIATVEAVATGYRRLTLTRQRVSNKVEEDKNGASQVRIGRSSGVKEPATPEAGN